jgi:predicted DNA-binding protein (MmcQ/YjbR family)
MVVVLVECRDSRWSQGRNGIPTFSLWQRPQIKTTERSTRVDIDIIRDYCLGKKENVTEDMPFGEDVLVFRVKGKIFVLTRLMARPLAINLKCDPGKALELREQYDSVVPGYHMNKKYWNTVILDGSIPVKHVFAMIDHSYNEVLKGTLKKTTLRPAKKRKKK